MHAFAASPHSFPQPLCKPRHAAARNCLVTHDWQAKISDFGFARAVNLEQQYRATYMKRGNVVLPLRWVAPEVFAEGRFGELSDVWSFGVTMWEIFSRGKVCSSCYLCADKSGVCVCACVRVCVCACVRVCCVQPHPCLAHNK